jgi:hypothetical protein
MDSNVRIPLLGLELENVLMYGSLCPACTSGHLDARSQSNVEFLAISLAVESQPSSRVGATPHSGVWAGVCRRDAPRCYERAGQLGKTSR